MTVCELKYIIKAQSEDYNFDIPGEAKQTVQ